MINIKSYNNQAEKPKVATTWAKINLPKSGQLKDSEKQKRIKRRDGKEKSKLKKRLRKIVLFLLLYHRVMSSYYRWPKEYKGMKCI